jgi:hypothetical protein
MNPLFILGVFILGASTGGLCVLLHQMGVRAKFRDEIEDKLDKALFDPVRRKESSLFRSTLSDRPSRVTRH